jgi:hypothetical protein
MGQKSYTTKELMVVRGPRRALMAPQGCQNPAARVQPCSAGRAPETLSSMMLDNGVGCNVRTHCLCVMPVPAARVTGRIRNKSRNRARSCRLWRGRQGGAQRGEQLFWAGR